MRVSVKGVCVYCETEEEGRECVKCVCTLCLASVHMLENALHTYVHVSLTDTIIQQNLYQLMYMY